MSKARGCLLFFLNLIADYPEDGKSTKGKRSAQSDPDLADLPYRAKSQILSQGENAFFQVLLQAVGSQLYVCVKPNLADVIYVERGTNQKQGFRNRIDRKHVDFLFCKPQTMQPILAIELDDKSHDRPDRKKRDEFVDAVYRAARLPILHVRAKASYDPATLRSEIQAALKQQL